jgi:hypothetical protein
MAQLFGPQANSIARASLLVLLLGVVSLVGGIVAFDRTDYASDRHHIGEQPVQFSHQHHAGVLGIHCANCHTTAETSSFAGIPPTHTCMTCHSQIWLNSPILEPVRASYRTGQPLSWVRVHDLPGFVYFNHSIHLRKGIGCASCHGRVDEMAQIYKVGSLQMEWCLDCHRNPTPHLRPRDRIYDMNYQPPTNQAELGRKLAAEYNVRSLLDCYTCHR